MPRWKLALSGLSLLACNVTAPPVTAERDAAASPADRESTPSPGLGPDGGTSTLPDLWVSFPDVSGEAPPPGAGGPTLDVVYAHSGSDLFRVDPETLDVTRVGPLRIVDAMGRTRFLNTVTDLAVDRARKIIGVTFTELLEIDASTAECRILSLLSGSRRFNGLSWIHNPGGPEMLVATTMDGSVFRIDVMTGNADRLGGLGGGLQSSGDLVSVATFGTLVTVIRPGSDHLARIDPMTGAATLIGPTGFQGVWGLGFWKNKVFGFTNTGQFILIDPRTGAGTLVRSIPAFPFWGAGVTTAAVVID
jgi:hypothetical protein